MKQYVKLFEEFVTDINEKKFIVDATYTWVGKEWDPKKKDNVVANKKVTITKIEGNKVFGRFEGTSDEYVIREPEKYLKAIKESAVSTTATGAPSQDELVPLQLQDPVHSFGVWNQTFAGSNRSNSTYADQLTAQAAIYGMSPEEYLQAYGRPQEGDLSS